MSARILLLIALVAVPLSSRAADEGLSTPACPVSDELATPDEPLEQFAAAITGGGPVNILAVGSATTVGANNEADPAGSYPYRMAQALHAALPRITFKLTVRGGRGMTAETMLPLLNDALATQAYPLVVWQTGTVEAVRSLPPDGMQTALQDGIDRVRQSGGDVVLVDAQFSRFLRANTDLGPYEDVLQEVAAIPGVVLFHRFDIMRAWATDGQIDLERTPKAQRVQAMTQLSTCLGQALARFVLNGVDSNAASNAPATVGAAAPPR